MAKLSNKAISKEDLFKYIESTSDFDFELSVLKMLNDNGLTCEHGGSYEDPVTGLMREFDIRATKVHGKYRLRLAVECKNLRENFPLLISCTPRGDHESFHNIAYVGNREEFVPENVITTDRKFAHASILRIESPAGRYKTGEPVGKSTMQVGEDTNGNLTSNDSEVFAKWGQCLSSAVDVVRSMADEGESHEFYSTVLPIVVVPDGRLWSVRYDEHGERDSSDPTQVESISCFVGKEYEIGVNHYRLRYAVSHIEFMTFSHLARFAKMALLSLEEPYVLFSREGIQAAIEVRRSQD